MKKIKDQTQKKNLYYAIGVLVLVLAYVLGFRNLQKVNEEQATRVSELESQNAACSEMKKKQSENEEAIQQMQKEMDDILKTFPADVKEDDVILYANDVEQNQGMQFSATYFSQSNLEEAGQVSGYDLNARPVQYTFSAGYDQFKNVLQRISEQDQTKSLSSLTLGYDMETGNLQGDMTINFYSIDGNDQKYKATDNPGISQGNQNPFATAQ